MFPYKVEKAGNLGVQDLPAGTSAGARPCWVPAAKVEKVSEKWKKG